MAATQPPHPPATATVDRSAHQRTPSNSASNPFFLVILASEAEPHRVGQAAPLHLFRELRAGRGDQSGDDFLRLGFHRPGEPLVVIPGQEFIAGDRVSRVHAIFKATYDGVEMTKLGARSTYVNGKECEKTTLLQEGDTVLLARQVLLLVTRRPLHLSMPVGGFGRELHPFGGMDADGHVGESRLAWESRTQLHLAAQSSAHVLIRGETGTGKESAAAAVHALSRRAARKRVTFNAAGLTPSMVMSELFGTVADVVNRGMASRKGVLGEADGGTLFLDEVGELSLEAQAALLRPLQNGEYNRVGDSVARTTDVWVTGATNRDDSVFRSDFVGRFGSVAELHPLRARREDIALLIRFLLVKLLGEYPQHRERLFFLNASGQVEPRVSIYLVLALVHHPLPRNVRELESLLREALMTSPGDTITLPRLETLPELPAARDAAPTADAGEPRESRKSSKPTSAKAHVSEITKPQVVAAMKRRDNNVTKAAKDLDVGRTAMYDLLRRFGLMPQAPTK